MTVSLRVLIRGRPLGRWKDWVEEYLEEKSFSGGGVLDQARKECWNRERKRLCRGHLMGDVPRGKEMSELFVDR